jgi:4-hydroxy-tetrahydrodipicolinate synthase
MSKKLDLRGVICPMVTPFDEEGKIDAGGVERLITHLYHGRIQYLLPSGTTGEGILLSHQERKDLAEMIVEYAKGKCKVIVHTGCASTRETLILTQHAYEIGADAASIITPFFYSLSDEEIIQHYSFIAQEVDDFPLVLYSYPGNAKNRITTRTLVDIVKQNSQYIGIKLSDVDLIQFQDYVRVTAPDFRVLCGVDALMLPALSIGSMGQVSGNANVFPEIFSSLYESYNQGNLVKAQHLQRKINQIRQILKDNIAYFKAALNIMGLPVGKTRPPLRWVEDQSYQELERQLTDVLKSQEQEHENG